MNPSSTTRPLSDNAGLTPQRFSLTDIRQALITGWAGFRSMPGPSMAYALPFALIGGLLLAGVGIFGISPMALPFAGGFMLVGPALLSGFFRLSEIRAAATEPRLPDAFKAFLGAPVSLWLVSLVCAFLFLVWITDAGILYVIIIGTERMPYKFPWLIDLQEQVVAFQLWGLLMGTVLAFILFAISAFSVPLLYERRSELVPAINVSVRAVFRSFTHSILWGLLLTTSILFSILLLPLFPVILPTLAYASFALYRRVFPVPGQDQNST